MSKLWGPSGDPFDYVVNDYLPELEIGDWLLWKNMGAYTTVFSNSFNGFQPPSVFAYMRRSAWYFEIFLFFEILFHYYYHFKNAS